MWRFIMKKLCSFILVLTLAMPCYALESLRERATRQMQQEYKLLMRNIDTVNKLMRRRGPLTQEEKADLQKAGKRALIGAGIIITLAAGAFGVYTLTRRGASTVPSLQPEEPQQPEPQPFVRPYGPPPPLPPRPPLVSTISQEIPPALPPRDYPPVQPPVQYGMPSVLELPAEQLPPVQLEEEQRRLIESSLQVERPQAIVPEEVINVPEAPPLPPAPGQVLSSPKTFAQQLAEKQKGGLKKPQPVQAASKVQTVDPQAELLAKVAKQREKLEEQAQQRQQQQTQQTPAQPGKSSSIRITRQPVTLKLKAPQTQESRPIAQALQEQVAAKTSQSSVQSTQSSFTPEELAEWETDFTASQEKGLQVAREQFKAKEQAKVAQPVQQQQTTRTETQKSQESKEAPEEKQEPGVTTSVLERFKAGIQKFFGATGSSTGTESSLEESYTGD